MLMAVAELIAKAVHMRAVEEENRRLRMIIGRTTPPSSDIIGTSKVMQEVFGMIHQVADSNTTVLIHGETGTGKELVARAIHMHSPRSAGPLVQVNCAAMPDTLLESELFGHEKGAFTGALQKRRGRFEEADGGTIFLDEVGELSAAAQAKLLRVLQERQFQPLGSSRTVHVNVRIIAATNRNLEEDVASGRFRADLYYRLNVFPVYLPPLRERGNDIILLADHFIRSSEYPPPPWMPSWRTTGRAMCGSWKIVSSGRCCWRAATPLKAATCPPPCCSIFMRKDNGRKVTNWPP
jgi:Nif-specific regulatory protein